MKKPRINPNKFLLNIISLHPVLRIIIITLFVILSLILFAKYADMSVHNYGVGVVNTYNSPKIESIEKGFLNTFVRWDSNHYIQIAEQGYTKQQTAFFPLYPLLVRAVSNITNTSYTVSLFITSWIFSIMSFIVFFYWTKYELSIRNTQVSSWLPLCLLAVFPTSFFLISGYSESLFFFLTVSSLYAYRTKHYFISGIFIAISTATRVQGGALAVFYLMDYIFKKDWRNWKKLIPVLFSPIGIALYMTYLLSNYGNPFEFISAQANWGRLNGNIIINLMSSFTPVYLWYITVLTVGLWAIFKKLGWSWFIYSIVFILIPITSGRLDSLNRYMLVLPPLFLSLSLISSKTDKRINYLYIGSCIMLFSWNLILFTNNYWVG